MRQRMYRLAQIASTQEKSGLMPVSPATIWRWVRSGNFPQPFKLGPSVTVWDADAVDAFIAAQQGAH